MKVIKRWATIIVGGLVLAAGVLLIPVPGPGGLPVTLAGLAILSSELPWARRCLERLKPRVPWTRNEPLGVPQRWWRIGVAVGLLTLWIVGGVVVWRVWAS